MSSLDLSIVVPVLNEEASLRALNEEITEALATTDLSWEVIFVDDGSTDDSAKILNELYDYNSSNTRVIELARNFGQTAALAAGFDASVGEVIVPIDADLQNDPADIPRVVAELEKGADVVSGWRRHRKDAFLSRRLPSMIANLITGWITGVRLHDYGCTLKAYRREAIEQMHLYGELHRFLPALASQTGARVSEIDVNHRPRQHGQSKYGIDRTLRVIIDLITVRFLQKYLGRPMQIFGRWGFYCFIFAGLSGFICTVQKVFPPHLSVNRNGWFFLFIMSALSGLQLLSIGLIGEIITRTYFESQGKPTYMIARSLGLEAAPEPDAVDESHG